ncbi:MAG: class I SAM-dependent methyltransferase [Deltaproteobacteria bacterium]|nr:class I SAM-dependent methyltransferase [Deltaproteobacteria bacterium]
MDRKYVEYFWTSTSVPSHDYVFPAVLKLIRITNLSGEAFILDTGCGGRALVKFLYAHGFQNVYGFDASPSGIELAKMNYSEISDRFFVHDVYESKLPEWVPSKYDLIVSTEVIEHLYDPQTYLSNIKKWLAENGYVILTTPYHGYLKNLLIALLDKHDDHYNPLWAGGHIKFFSKSTIAKLVNEAGFQIISFCGCGRLPFLWKSMAILAKKR